ncbi:HMP-PP phosphatase [Entomohabitans teleogrylli]|uniref:HMP-PP phosphatase n=1 Tax=Entomohabitans teleogrylli TaxID=1384589 RepID=UPI00073D795D|nr:HMP-PP phosphatase [Entomohabitans teleogrylli]
MARLAAFDMDGTLLMANHRLGDETIRTLRRLRDYDVTLAFATGRHALEMRHLLAGYELDAWMITGNGTRIHSADGEVLYRHDLAPEVAEIVLQRNWNTRASVHVFNDSGWLTGESRPEMLAAHALSGFRYQLTELKTIPAHLVSKICFCGDHDDLRQLQEQLAQCTGDAAHLCFSAFDCLEVLPRGCNKGAALAVLGERLGIALSDCMAFGDAMNDREMLSLVGHGFIMGNAMPQLKAELPHLPVIGHCNQQAVSHYLTSWLDQKNLTYSPE